MSAFIVNDETIHAIVKGFEKYGAEFKADDYRTPTGWLVDLAEIRNGIGQSLLNQNYASVNYRYREETETPKYNYKDVEINEGVLLGCIQCYEYQACETNGYFKSKIHAALNDLKMAMLERMIKEKGYEIPWGYEI